MPGLTSYRRGAGPSIAQPQLVPNPNPRPQRGPLNLRIPPRPSTAATKTVTLISAPARAYKLAAAAKGRIAYWVQRHAAPANSQPKSHATARAAEPADTTKAKYTTRTVTLISAPARACKLASIAKPRSRSGCSVTLLANCLGRSPGKIWAGPLHFSRPGVKL